jgi:hypothetical protein
MDPIGHTLGLLLMSYIATPKDAVRFASVNKSMRRLERDVVYVAVRVSAADTEAVAWLLTRAARIPSVRIACTNARGEALSAAHTLARAWPGACQLELDSKLFKCLLRLLERDGARLVTLLKRHARACMREYNDIAVENEVLAGFEERYNKAILLNDREVMEQHELGLAELRQMIMEDEEVSELRGEIIQQGYDSFFHPFGGSRGGFTKSSRVVTSGGESDQLDFVLDILQPVNEEECSFEFKATRKSDGNEFTTEYGDHDHPVWAVANENTTDWWLVAAHLYSAVKMFEFYPANEKDMELFDSDYEDEHQANLTREAYGEYY